MIGSRSDRSVSKMEDLVHDNLWDKCTECEENKKIIITNITNSDDSVLLNKLKENGETFHNSNQTEMINSTQNNDVETLAADKALSDLSEEQLRDVLEQLTDHNLPDSEKCPLVRRLNAENASKDESDLVISTFCKSSTPSSSSSSSTCRNSGRKSRSLHKTGSKDAEFVRDKTNGNNSLKKVHSSQSLQDLMCTNSDYDSMRSIGVNRSGKRLNKASRANSFTMPSGSQTFCNNNNNSKETCSELSSSPDLTNSSNLRTNNSQQQLQSQQSFKSNRNKNVKSRPTSYISTSSVTALCENESNNCNAQTCDYQSEVLSTSSSLLESTKSSRTFQECYATQSVHFVQERDNHNMDCDKNSTSLCNSAQDNDNDKEAEYSAETELIELKDLRRKVNIIEYTSEKINDNFDSDSHNNKSFNNVDSFLDLGLTSVNSQETIKTGVAERMINHNLDYDSTDNPHEDNKSLQTYQGIEGMTKTHDETSPLNPHSEDLANFQHISPYSNKSDSTARNANSREKKKKKIEPTKLAEQIEGHIGFIKDIEYLEAFVNSTGNESSKQLTDFNVKNTGSLILNTSSSVKENTKKKEKGITISANSIPKRKNGNNVSPNQSSCGIDSNKNNVTPNIPSSTSSSSFSSDEANSVSKHSEFAQKTDSLIITSETTSPINSSSQHNKHKTGLINREDSSNLDDEKRSHSTVNSTFSLISSNMSVDEHLYAASDSEMADREKGFVTPKSKHLRRRKGLSRRTNNYGSQKSPIPSMQSSTSTTPSSSTVSGTGVYGRGYESEREYTDEYGQKEAVIRRKSMSSVPHSEQNSAYNSDGELSSHSMPVRNNDSHIAGKRHSQSRTTPSSISSTPKASYADIAKSFNFGVSFYKRASVDGLYTTNAMIGPLSINTCVQYEDFPQLDLSLPPVADVSTPSSPSNNSKMIEALVSPPQKSIPEKRDFNSDSYSAPTSMTNTPVPQNECLFSETVKNSSNTEIKTIEIVKGSVVPPVIMCDYSDSVPLSDIGSVTFGFFDDLNTASGQQTIQSEKAIPINHSSEQKAKSPIKPSPETTSHMNNPKVSTIHLTYIDVDKKSFNYDHIIGFIKKEWDTVKSDYNIENYESTNQVK